MKKEINITRDKIFELYGDYLLNHAERPKSIYQFAKKNGFDEKEFYDYFTSFDQIESQMLSHLFLSSQELVADINDTEMITAKEKLLNLYFIFFENMTMNRSLVLMIFGKDKLNSMKILQNLKVVHRDFVRTLDFQQMEILSRASDNAKKLSEKSKEEVLWLHLVSSIEFWKKDTSPSFEKTDLYIEKTIDTGFELIENEPLKKVLDLGKFLWKETFKSNQN